MLTVAIVTTALLAYAAGFVGGRGFWTDRGLAMAEGIISAELDRRTDELFNEAAEVYIEELKACQEETRQC